MSTSRTGWTLPIRRWLVIALITLFVIPFAGLGFTASALWDGTRQGDAIEAAEMLRRDSALWQDSSWQAATSRALGAGGIDFVLFVGGQETFRSTGDPLGKTNVTSSREGAPWEETGSRGVRQLVIDGSNPVLSAHIYEPMGGPTALWLVPLVGIVLLLIVLVILGWVVGRMLVSPLAATSRAASQVAGGDLDISLPSSRVREVEEVNAAFESMSAGLRRSLEQQAEVEQERRFFIGAVVHDLRTPLFALRGYLEGMEKGLADTPEKQQQYIATAQDKAASLGRLVSDLSDYSRLEYLGRPPEKERIDVATLVEQLIEAPRHQADALGLRLVFEPAIRPCEVDADPHLLARVVENLLDNALRYTPSGGVVTVSCGKDAESVWLRVADTGPGIQPGDLPNLFAPLFRGEASRNRRTGGNGLGLTIALRIMHAHGGDLKAENRLDGGAIFTALLPLPVLAIQPDLTASDGAN